MKTKQFFILITLLFGLNFMCQAQTSNKEKETPKERTERIKREKATKDSLNVVLRNNKKQATKETPKERTERIKREKATKDSVSTASYQQEIERLQKKNADQEKLVADLSAQADAKVKVEQKLADAEKKNFDLTTELDAKKSYAASVSNQLLALEAKAIENKTYEKAKVDTSVKTPPVVEKDTTKKVPPVPKKTIAQTCVIATMTKGDSTWVPAKEKELVPMPKKGTIIEKEGTLIVRESDEGKFKDKIESSKQKGVKIKKAKK